MYVCMHVDAQTSGEFVLMSDVRQAYLQIGHVKLSPMLYIQGPFNEKRAFFFKI